MYAWGETAVYAFTTTATTPVVEHADHIWEEWHAYLADELPEQFDREDSGLCCHTCHLVIVDQPTTDHPAI